MDNNSREHIFDYVNNKRRFCELSSREQIAEARKIEDMYRFLLFYLEKGALNIEGNESKKLLKPIEANMVQWPESIFLKFLRFPYKAVHTIAVKTRLYDRIVKSKIYYKIAESGLFFALGRKK